MEQQEYKVRIYKVNGDIGWTVQGDTVEETTALYEQIKNLEAVPFTKQESTRPKNAKYPERVEGGKCPNCAMGHFVKNPKTGKLFCDQKCWLNK